MSEFISNNYIALAGMVLLFLFLYNNKTMKREHQLHFYLILVFALVELIAANADEILSNAPVFSRWRIFAAALGYSVRPIIVYLLLGLTINLKKHKKLYRYLGIGLILNAMLAFSAFFTGAAYHFEDNRFNRGPLGFLFFAILIFYLLATVISVSYEREEHTAFFRLATWACALMCGLAMLFEATLYPMFGVSRSSIILAVIFYYMFFQSREFFRSHDEITYTAMHDGLTKLYNRYAYDVFTEELSRSKEPMGFIIIDVDHFKSINDTYGHITGDMVLGNVANLLRQMFYEKDKIIRLGGDEFVILCPGMTRDHADAIERKIRYINTALGMTERSKLPETSVSVGVAFSESGFSRAVYKAADKALYVTKNNSRKGCTIADEISLAE